VSSLPVLIPWSWKQWKHFPHCSRGHALSTSGESCSRSREVVPRQPMLPRLPSPITFYKAGCSQYFPVNFRELYRRPGYHTIGCVQTVSQAHRSAYIISPWLRHCLEQCMTSESFQFKCPLLSDYASFKHIKLILQYVRRLSQTRITDLFSSQCLSNTCSVAL